MVFGPTPAFAASLDLSALDGTNGFVINGIDAGDSPAFGERRRGRERRRLRRPDHRGDGAIRRQAGGESYVVFGSDGRFAASLDLSALDGTNGFVIDGIDAGDYSGVR